MASANQKQSFVIKPEPVEEEDEEENSPKSHSDSEEAEEREQEERTDERETRRRRRNENRVKGEKEEALRAKIEREESGGNNSENDNEEAQEDEEASREKDKEELAAAIANEKEVRIRYKDKQEQRGDGEEERRRGDEESLLGEPVHSTQDEGNTSTSISTTTPTTTEDDNESSSNANGMNDSDNKNTSRSSSSSSNSSASTNSAATTSASSSSNTASSSDTVDDLDRNIKTGYVHSLPSTPLVMNARMRAAHEHVTKNEYDVDAWATYLTEIQAKPIAQCREFFERFFRVFPTASRQWRYWIDQELLLHNFELAETLLKRCLLSNLDIDLWKLYLRYIKQIKRSSEDEDKVIEEAFEFVVKHMGYDINSAPVWRAYVNVLKNVLAKSQGEFEEGEIIRKIRSVYQRACVLPNSNGEILWREYETWEHSLNKNLAKTLLAEHQPKHVNARICARKRKEMREGIVTVLLAVPPQEEKVPQSRFRIKHYNQLLLWKKYIAFEQSNLMNIDPIQLKKRVVFSYRQSLLTLRHFPEMWHEYAMYLHSLGATEECVKVYEEACAALPTNILIHFIFADYQEERKLFKETRSIYNALLYGTPILKESSSHNKEISGEEGDSLFSSSSSSSSFSSSSSSSSSLTEAEESKNEGNSDAMTDNTSSSSSSSFLDTQPQIIKSEQEKSLVYCHLMRFAQRCEGKEAARKVLFQARKNCSLHHPYIEAARIEQHLNNEPKIASKIFSFGLQDFLTTPDYVSAYLDFLMEISDYTNCRVIFERVFAAAAAAEKELLNYEATPGSVSPRRPEDIATPAIWARFVHFERVTGDITAIIKAEKRRAEKLPALRFHPFQELIDRHTLLDLLPCSQAYCESIAMGGVIEDSSSKQFDGNKTSTRVLTPAESKKIKRRYPRPNIGKLTTYKVGMEVKGAVGGRRLYADKPAPDALSTLIGMVPSKDVGGPRIDPLKLIACLAKITLPSIVGPHPGGDNKAGPMVTSSVKRKDADEDDGGDADGAPTHDPYRKRSLARRREQSKSKFQRTS